MKLLEKIARIEARGSTVGICAGIPGAPRCIFAHNAARPFPAASSIKLFVALAALEAVARGEVALDTKETVRAYERMPGLGVLAELSSATHTLRDLLYYLLVHSDNTAQNTIERMLTVRRIEASIAEFGASHTHYVPLGVRNEHVRSRTSPREVLRLLAGLWEGTLLPADERHFFLDCLARTRTTHLGLRTLPCALNTRRPLITAHYTKGGKVPDTVTDNLLLATPQGTLGISVFLHGITVTRYANNVDHAGTRMVANLVATLFRTWYTRARRGPLPPKTPCKKDRTSRSS